jgi:uncharacterized protein (TIGR02266 family)
MSAERQHPRYSVDIWVDYSALNSFTSSHLSNVSRGGACIRTEKPLPLDTDVKMVLWLPGSSAIRVRGRVVWSQNARPKSGEAVGAGVRFVDVPPTDRELLIEYLDALSRSPSPSDH